ncbi:MAG: mechanosensitive ion channel family protein [Deltaproteobacteria bacterium]|nr:mechanosensitive ion channel family protein [Deltaproteobacteria bacterium]
MLWNKEISVGRLLWLGLAIWMVTLAGPVSAKGDYQAATTTNPAIKVDELNWMVKPLGQEELVVEADAWLKLVKDKTSQISSTEIALIRHRKQVEAAKKAESALKSEEEQKGEQTTVKSQQAEKLTEKKEEAKEKTVLSLTELRDQRAALVEKLEAVLSELERKGGDPKPYRTYVKAISGIAVDVTDTSSTWLTVVGWLKSDQGGMKWAFNLLKFVATLLVFWILARIAGAATGSIVNRAGSKLTDLQKTFIVSILYRSIIILGLIVAVSALGINIGPLLALIGAAGFVVAFALQGTLSNFASGIMILLYRPFDVGDIITVSGESGIVETMNLMCTNLRSFDNKLTVIPNNSVWGNTITNATGHSAQRRVDLVFGIGYSSDADKAQAILKDIVTTHKLVLAEPAPVIRMHELADSSVNLICRPWVKTADYWTVYWDVTEKVKKHFDAEGINIPFPQQDVHLYQHKEE